MNGMERMSPEYLRLSLAAAMTLGLKPGCFYRDAELNCLNLLLTYPEGCQASCSYCGLSSDNDNAFYNRSFIRVDWPAYSLEEIIERAHAGENSLERICVSMVMHPDAVKDTRQVIQILDRELGLPISVLVNPSTIADGDLESFLEAGADMATVAIDAATEKLFDEHRGEEVGGPHIWERYWSVLSDAALVFGRGKFGCHLIAGLGETEKELVETVQRVRRLGGRSHMFSFYPEQGSRLMDAEPCNPSQFRRIQLARFLIDYDLSEAGRMEFDEQGRMTSFGIQGRALDEIVQSGEPFMTSGCPGAGRRCACNRPFGDGPPGDIRSFPFELNHEDIQLVRRQMAIYSDTRAAWRVRK